MRKISTILVLLFLLNGTDLNGREIPKVVQTELNHIFPGGYSELLLFLTDNEKRNIEAISKSKLNSQILTVYINESEEDNRFAILSNAIIRTHNILFFTILGYDGSVTDIRIFIFNEPRDFYPTESWLALLRGKSNPENLFPGNTLANITGATLTAQTICRKLREVLSIYQNKISELEGQH